MLFKTAYKFITKEKKYISLNRENTFVFYNLKWIFLKKYYWDDLMLKYKFKWL